MPLAILKGAPGAGYTPCLGGGDFEGHGLPLVHTGLCALPCPLTAPHSTAQVTTLCFPHERAWFCTPKYRNFHIVEEGPVGPPVGRQQRCYVPAGRAL